MSDGRFVFLDESNVSSFDIEADSVSKKPWKLLTVDDDLGYQQSLLYSLADLKVRERPVHILTANSATEAAYVLSQHDDISLVLLDVVMERDDAGLRLVENIRNIQGNALIRIILLTGQPGIAPRKEVMYQYDINEYWNKSEIDYETLKAIVAANFRSWQSMHELDKARLGLQMVVDASRNISSKYDTNCFIQVVMKEIGRFFAGEGAEPRLCIVKVDADTNLDSALVVATLGFNDLIQGLPLRGDIGHKFSSLCQQAISEQAHQFREHLSVLYFSGDSDTTYFYLVLAEVNQSLSQYHIHLLQVFSENISSGFMQIALVDKLSKLAYQDSELNIKNQNWLLRELSSMNDSDKKNSELMILELDDFDSHALSFSSEHILQMVSAVLKKVIETCHVSAVVTRIDPETFAVLCNKQHVLSGKKLTHLISHTNDINGYNVLCTLTVARIDIDRLDDYPARQILHMARSLLCYARSKGQSIIEYEPWYRDHLLRDYQVLGDLKAAIDNHEFYLVFQPKFDLENNIPIGLEALLRWNRDGKVIPPSTFIPLAERSGLITKLDSIAVALVVKAMRKLEKSNLTLPISVNATVRDILDPDYLQQVLDIVEVEKISAELIELEITESQAMESYAEIKPILEQLHSVGIHISIDDFGTGYSSLSHISQLAVDTIKIDISFVTHLHEDKASQEVVDLVMNLATLFEFSVVGEGVETEIQRDALLERGCRIGQGYYYAKPMAIDDLIVWLQQHESNGC